MYQHHPMKEFRMRMMYACMRACMSREMGDEPLFPPSSSRTLPNLDWTFLPTILPTFSLPVKETGGPSSSILWCPTVKIFETSLTHVYFLALHNGLSDVFATRDKASDGPGYIILLQDARNNLGHRDGAQRSAGRRLPNSRIACCHRDREIPSTLSRVHPLNTDAKRPYQPYTATGKLNADKTPRTPRGFGTGQNERMN
jgi:hypothetical protein